MRAALKVVVAGSTLALIASVVSAASFKLSSSDFKNNGTIPDKSVYNAFGCSGGNESPAIEWSNPPAGTKSFALLVHDPDAPTGGSGFWHWLVYDIPATTTSLPAGAGKTDGSGLPPGAKQGHTDFGTVGYGGPCPPPGSGKHHYNFTLYALKLEKLDVPANATAAFIGFSANANAIGKVKLTGIYERKK